MYVKPGKTNKQTPLCLRKDELLLMSHMRGRRILLPKEGDQSLNPHSKHINSETNSNYSALNVSQTPQYEDTVTMGTLYISLPPNWFGTCMLIQLAMSFTLIQLFLLAEANFRLYTLTTHVSSLKENIRYSVIKHSFGKFWEYSSSVFDSWFSICRLNKWFC